MCVCVCVCAYSVGVTLCVYLYFCEYDARSMNHLIRIRETDSYTRTQLLVLSGAGSPGEPDISVSNAASAAHRARKRS